MEFAGNIRRDPEFGVCNTGENLGMESPLHNRGPALFFVFDLHLFDLIDETVDASLFCTRTAVDIDLLLCVS